MSRSWLRRLVAGLRRRAGAVFKSRDEFDLTDGDIARPLLYLSLPIVVTNLLHTTYNLVDTIWLGRYSTDALAAISFAFPVVFFIISLGLGIAIAGSILVAQNVGSGDEARAEFAASQTFWATRMLPAMAMPSPSEMMKKTTGNAKLMAASASVL